MREKTRDAVQKALFEAYGMAGVMENYANLSTLIGTFSYRETQLLERYDEMLAALNTADSSI